MSPEENRLCVLEAILDRVENNVGRIFVSLEELQEKHFENYALIKSIDKKIDVPQEFVGRYAPILISLIAVIIAGITIAL